MIIKKLQEEEMELKSEIYSERHLLESTKKDIEIKKKEYKKIEFQINKNNELIDQYEELSKYMKNRKRKKMM
jgi:rubrerythrin